MSAAISDKESPDTSTQNSAREAELPVGTFEGNGETVPLTAGHTSVEMTTTTPRKSDLIVTTAVLDSINVAQMAAENRAKLEQLGGPNEIIAALRVDPNVGMSVAAVESAREQFGDNAFPESPMDSFFKMFIASFDDKILQVGSSLVRSPRASVIIVCDRSTRDVGTTPPRAAVCVCARARRAESDPVGASGDATRTSFADACLRRPRAGTTRRGRAADRSSRVGRVGARRRARGSGRSRESLAPPCEMLRGVVAYRRAVTCHVGLQPPRLARRERSAEDDGKRAKRDARRDVTRRETRDATRSAEPARRS